MLETAHAHGMVCHTHSELLDVVDDKLATGGLHNPPAVGGGVVGRALADGDTLSHSVKSATRFRRRSKFAANRHLLDRASRTRNENHPNHRHDTPATSTSLVSPSQRPPSVQLDGLTSTIRVSPRQNFRSLHNIECPPQHRLAHSVFRATHRRRCRSRRGSRFSCCLASGVDVDGGAATHLRVWS